FLDPLVFRPDSMLGVPGITAAYRAGNVAILNAPGNGIADDKAIYSYMPEIVRFYSGGEAKLPNVETWRCREPQALKYVLDRLPELVVKLVDGSGGYGMLVGPTATKA
ncbi:circularly permuted type 2 ATP-grasp protein, partial [Escherichia coli]|nr:circularly permuted type 2 ATP-grasp protein [Escherichia coli]